MASFKWDKTGLFAAGVLFGTAGIKLLSSKDAKKVYTECTAAVLRAKDCVMKTVTTVQMHSRSTRTEKQLRNHLRTRLLRKRLLKLRLSSKRQKLRLRKKLNK